MANLNEIAQAERELEIIDWMSENASDHMTAMCGSEINLSSLVGAWEASQAEAGEEVGDDHVAWQAADVVDRMGDQV